MLSPRRSVGRVKQDDCEYLNPKPSVTRIHVSPTLSLVLVTAPISGLAGASLNLIHHAWAIITHLLMSWFLGCFVEVFKEVGGIERPWVLDGAPQVHHFPAVRMLISNVTL